MAYMVEISGLMLAFVLSLPMAVADIRTGLIRNRFTVSAFAAGLLFNSSISGIAGLKSSLLGFAIGFAVLLIPYLLGGMGGGDVKMLAAVCSIVAYPNALFVVLGMALCGGLLSVSRMAMFYRYAEFLKRIRLLKLSEQGDASVVPYGVAISAGILLVVLYMLILGR